MKTEDYEAEAEKISWEGGIGEYVENYGAKTDDKQLQKLYDKAEKAIDDIHKYFKSKGVDLNDY